LSFCSVIHNRFKVLAFSLLRPLAEATFRGFWIARCASDEKSQHHVRHKKQIDTATIIRELLFSR
jgi:hypothetical protein